MRPASTTLLATAMLVMVAAAAAQEVITDFAEYTRKKAEYDRQKKVYDEYQSIANVPVLAGYDLITKFGDADAPAGNAEQLLPNYTGIPVDFTGNKTSIVEPGNAASSAAAPISEPGTRFAAAPAPAPVAAPIATSFAPAPAPFRLQNAFPVVGQRGSALFFGQGALPAQSTELFADAPVQASVPLTHSQVVFAPSPALFQVPSSGLQPVPITPLRQQYMFPPSLPHSDFHPGPARGLRPAARYGNRR